MKRRGHEQWSVEFHQLFAVEVRRWPKAVQIELLAHAKLLERFGPTLRRPHADTLVGSQLKNLKELRFDADNGVWRIAFAFDPRRCAVLLAGGNKAGSSSRAFYRHLISRAEERYRAHLDAQLPKGHAPPGRSKQPRPKRE